MESKLGLRVIGANPEEKPESRARQQLYLGPTPDSRQMPKLSPGTAKRRKQGAKSSKGCVHRDLGLSIPLDSYLLILGGFGPNVSNVSSSFSGSLVFAANTQK